MWKSILVLSMLVGLISVQKTVAEMSPPRISEPTSAKEWYYESGTKVVLRCHAESTNPVSYKWLWDGEIVKADKDRRTNEQLILFDSKTGNLTIFRFSSRFNGDYACVATASSASSMSQKQSLRESVLGTFKKVQEVKKAVTEYEYVELPCSNKGEIKVGPDDISYNWYLTEKSKEVQSDSGRLFIDVKGNLHFTYVKKTDESNDDKLYLCGYSSISLRRIVLGNSIRMSVAKVDTPQDIKPALKYSTETVKGRLHSSARLECFFSGYDPSGTGAHLPTIKWFDYNGNEILPVDEKDNPQARFILSSHNRVLTVKDLKETDDKVFYCQGFSKSGVTIKFPVKLDVVSPPIWRKAPESATRSEGKSVSFHCDARSLANETAPNKIEWYINGDAVDATIDFNHFVFSSDKKLLTIKDLKKPKDIMCVQCEVTNSIGSIMADACLNVLKPIVISVKPPEVQEIKMGDTIELTVKATTDPYVSHLNYEWTYKNTTYKSPKYPPFVEKDPLTDRSFINTSHLTQKEYNSLGGIYYGRVSHYDDQELFQTEVVLKDYKPVPVTASAGIDMWIIGLIICIICLIVVAVIVIFVICRKQQEGDYNVDKKETGAGLDPEKELRDKGFNDLSRPDYDDYDYPEKKPRGDLEYDDVPIGGDDESLGEYGDEEDTHFNEDGSFIGIYQKRENERQNHKTESTI